jgi:signal transduction histidine kinase
MDITVVVRAGLIYSLTIGILSTAYAFLMPAIANVIARLLAIPRQSVSFYLSLLLLILFYPVLRMLRGIVDKRFFRTVYDERQILRETSQAFAAARETPVLIEIIRQAIEHTLMPREIAVFLPDSDGVLSRMEHGGSWDLLPGLLPDSEPLLAFAVQQDDVLITEDLLSLFGVECDIGQRLRSWGVQVALPLVAGKQLCGMIMLGAKRSRDQYSIDDAALLRIVSKQAATALDNAYHYETLRRVNTQLEQRVHVRTQQLAIANAQLERTNTALEAERAYLSAAVDILPIPIFFRSHSGEIIRYNKAYAELHAREGNEERHQLLDPATHLPLPLEQWPSFRALHGEIIRASELRMQLPDSREIPVYTHAGPIYAGDELVAAVVVVQDISALKAADRAKDEFLAVVSHELKTPLTCILAWTEVAQFETDQTIISKALSIIEDKALLQRHLLNDLLDVSRIVHNKLLLHPKPVDLWALACHAVGDFEHLAEEHQLVLQLQPPTTELPIIADSDRLAQVVFNLLVNAMKFTDAGGLITVSGRRDGAFAFLDITDTGRGIPVEMLPDIFFPFRQVQRIEPSGGLGLGLALVKGITELHHGRVTAASDGMGHGSTFTVAFPLATTAAVSESMQVSCHPVPSHRSWV